MQLIELRHLADCIAFRDDTIDSAHCGSGPRIQRGERVGWNPDRMFNDVAVHVDDPQRTVRPCASLDGTKPRIRRCQKLAVKFIVIASTGKRHSARCQNLPMHKIVDRLAGKGIARIAGTQQIVSINSKAAGRRRPVRRPGQHEQHLTGNREQSPRLGPGSNSNHGLRRGQIGIATQIMVSQRIMHEHRSVVAAEPVAPVIANSPLLRRSRSGLENSGVRIEAEIPLAQSDHGTGLHAGDFTTKQTARTIDPAIKAIFQAVDSSLIVVSRKAREQLPHVIRFSITVRVFRIQDVRGGTNQQTISPNRHSGWKRNAIEKNFRPIVLTITVVIVHAPNLSAIVQGFRCISGTWRLTNSTFRLRLSAYRPPLRIIIHFCDPQPPIGAESNRDGTFNQRFRRDKFCSKAGFGSQRGNGLSRRQRGHSISLRGVDSRRYLCLELRFHTVNNDLFNARGVRRGDVIVDHRPAAFVAAFTKNALRWNIARTRIRVGIQPQPTAIQFAFQSQRVIDDDFSGKEDPREFVTKGNGLNRITDLRHQRFAAIQSSQLSSCMMSDGILLLRPLFPLFPTRQRREFQSHTLNQGCRRLCQSLQLCRKQTLDLFRNFLAETFGSIRTRSQNSAPRIGVGSASDGDQGLASWIAALDMIHGKSGPVATDHVVTERHAMAGIVRKDGSQFAVEILDRQQRQIVIHRTAVRAAIHRKRDVADSPRQSSWLPVGQSRDCDHFQLRFKFFSVLQNCLPLIVGNRLAKKCICAVPNHRSAVSVGSADRQATAIDAL